MYVNCLKKYIFTFGEELSVSIGGQRGGLQPGDTWA